MTRDQLIAWCRERARANRVYSGEPLTPAELKLVRVEWPVYFIEIASLLERDAPKPEGKP